MSGAWAATIRGPATHCQRAPFQASVDDNNVFTTQAFGPDVYSGSSQQPKGHL